MRRHIKRDMTLVSTIPAVPSELQYQNPTDSVESFEVNTESVIHPDEQSVKNANSAALQELFQQTLNEKGENVANQFKWVAENEIQVDGLSSMTLHNFILKAEELGKKVTYRRSIVLTISD